LPIYNAEELPEPTELNAINRSVPAMPTGMEKEEESEKHLQDILVRPFLIVIKIFNILRQNVKFVIT
jgi:hypothetical protein